MDATSNRIDDLIKESKLTYISDTSWGYFIEKDNYCIDFFQDEAGKNHIEQFMRKEKGVWFEIVPTDEQIKLMFQILNDTPYRDIESESETIDDNCDFATNDFY